jgi:polyisoprenoid-binding protein YceI
MTSINSNSTGSLSAFTGTWELDPKKTTVNFRTKAMWVLPVKGTANALSGNAKISPEGDITGTLVIDAASFDTKNKKRDDHLRSEDFLEVVKYPTITFTANSGRVVGSGRFEIDGVLTVHGRSQPLTLHAEVTGTDGTAKLATEVEIDRSRWDVSWAKMGAGLKNQIVISAHFDRV